MNTILYWFSGTGNSLAVARALAEKLGETRLISIPRAMKGETPPAERIGLVFPVYAFGPPKMVAEFVDRLPADASDYIFSVATMGGMPGATHAILRSRLRRRGLDLAAGWSIALPGNCIMLYQAPTEQKQRKLIDKSAARVQEIANAVAAGRRGRFQDSLPPLNWIARWLWPKAMKQFPGSDKKFFATDACTHCGLCEQVCPAENIRLVDGRPQWQHRCEACCACLNLCPVEAIQYGRKTVGRRRYCHPNVKPTELGGRS
jgi:ferredoxin